MTAGNHNAAIEMYSDGGMNSNEAIKNYKTVPRRPQSIHFAQSKTAGGISSHHNLRQYQAYRRRSANRFNGLRGAQQVNSLGNYTPILRQQGSAGAGVQNRFKRRLGTEPLVFSEA